MSVWQEGISMKEVLRVNGLCKAKILHNIDLKVEEGEMVAIMGPSGSGKSTLLYNISGMDNADEGEIYINDKDIMKLSEDDKAKLRLNEMGFVFQQMNVISSLNVLENIVLPVNHSKKGKSDKKGNVAKAKQLMQEFGIGDIVERKVNEVSGGQLQRACIVRSIMNDPKILFADEPTGALNQSAAGDVIDTFNDINKKGTTILMVTHDAKVAKCCDRIIYILDGQIKGELALGKYDKAKTKERESKVNDWLALMGW